MLKIINAWLETKKYTDPNNPLWCFEPVILSISVAQHLLLFSTIKTRTTTQPFYGSLDFVRDYPGDLVTRKVKPIWIYWSKR